MSRVNELTVVMYHYVRELVDSRFPEIKGLAIEEFIQQLNYFERNYTFVTMEECLTSLETGMALPKEPILLTFDDGYIDHFLNVFPILSRRGIQGSFFPPARAVLERRVLDVNKIHFILASAPNITQLLNALSDQIENYRYKYNLKPINEYAAELNLVSRYDSPEVMLIKCLLQYVLPLAARECITDNLFKKFLDVSECVFARELYMNVEQLKMMHHAGMYIGSHSFDHVWLDKLNPKQQEQQIDLSLEFLDLLGVNTAHWVMCYPYGAYNDSLLSILQTKGCRLGLTTKVGVANLVGDQSLVLSRFDTNDFPVWEHKKIKIIK